MTDYEKYRGKCLKLSTSLVDEDPSLTLVRGYYFCPIWGREEQHWWCRKPNRDIVDPTKRQFPSNGNGIYTEFNGLVCCEECGKEMREEEAYFMGRYPVCSDYCARTLVGV